MQQVKNRIIGLFLILVLGMGTMTGCGNRNAKNEDIVLTVFAMPSGYIGEQVGWFADVIYEKFHVRLEFINAYDANLMVSMETNTIADIIIFNQTSYYINAAVSNLLLDWNEMNIYDEYGTYIQEYLSQSVDRVAGLTEDNLVRGIGSNIFLGESPQAYVQYGGDIRWDLYAKLGYPAISTLEDYVEVFQDMQSLYPMTEEGRQVYALSLFPDWDNELSYFASAIAGMYGYEQMGTGYYDATDGTWQDSMDRNGIYIRVLRYLNSLYRAGLIDPDSAVQTYDNALGKYQSGAVLYSPMRLLGSTVYNTMTHLSEGKAMYSCLPEDAVPVASYESVYGDDNIWCIGNTSVYPEVCMQLLNWLFSPEGKMVANYGPQGITWDYDEQGNPFFTEFGLECFQDSSIFMPDGYTGTYADGFPEFFVNTLTDNSDNTDANGQPFRIDSWNMNEESTDTLTAIEEDFCTYTGYTNTNEYLLSGQYTLIPDSGYAMSEMDTETYLALVQSVSVILNGSWNAIYAKDEQEFDNIVSNMITNVQESPYEKCTSYYKQEAADRYAEEH